MKALLPPRRILFEGIIAVALLLFSKPTWGQCDNLVTNGELSWTSQPPCSSNPSAACWSPMNVPTYDYYPPWRNSHGTPHATTASTSSPSAMEFVATYLSGRPAGQQMFSEGFSQGISTLVPGKQYIVALQSKRINSYMASSTRAAHVEVEVSSTAPLPTNSLHQGGWARPSVNGSQNLLSFEPNTSGFMLYADCFYPDSAWSNIWLYTSNPDSLGSTIGSTVDDIEIIENFDFAGPDTLICDTTQSVDIGRVCNSLNLTPTYSWINLNTGQPEGNTAIITVSPNVTTQYEVTRNFVELNCPAKDTVTVVVNSMEIDLGPDQEACEPASFQLDAGYFQNALYHWNTGEGTQTISVNQSGTYIVEVWVLPDCYGTDTVEITINPKPNVQLNPAGSFCVTDPSVNLNATPPGGNYSGTGVNASGIFDPGAAGPRTHTIEYSYTNAFGCSDSKSIDIDVYEAVSVSIEGEDLPCLPVSGMQLSTISSGSNLTYHWSTGESTSSITALNPGIYEVTVYGPDSACQATASFEIEIEPCCSKATDYPLGDTIFNGNSAQYINDTLVFDGNIVIEANATLNISNSVIIMRNCSKIEVQRGGELIIDGSSLGYCEWLGIEVWGHMDACSNDFSIIGQMTANEMVLRDASVGILLGKRDPGALYDYAYAGGVARVYSSIFTQNYTDILFTPHAWLGMCTCADPDGTIWHSDIQNNDFRCLAEDPSPCEDFVDPILEEVELFTQGPQNCPIWNMPPNTLPSAPGRCHIIDLTPFIEYVINNNPGILSCGDACDKAAHVSGSGNVGDMLGNITNNNTYCNDCTPNVNFK